jgi:dolichyl-diphosphooligosaccharide--protein glycosyltransferase
MPPEAESERSRVYDATVTFLEDHPERHAALEAVLDADADADSWRFEDVDADSGTFGELVSLGVVEGEDGEYRIADREAVAAALAGEPPSETADSADGFEFNLDVSFDPRATAALVGALAFLFVMRITAYRSVFRGDRVVSPGNDPYYYRYWMERLLAESSGPADWGVVATLPEGAAARRPFTHAANWWLAELLGGSQAAAAQVAAWLPVAGALALGVVLYRLGTVLTGDRRVGVAAVVLLATVPVHAVYSGVGFLEHRLHQYFWLGVTALELARLAVDLQRRRETASSADAAVRSHLGDARTWLAALALGVATGISAHVWGGSPLVFAPLALYVALRAAMDARAGVSPLRASLPLVAGLGVGGALSALLHVGWGWHQSFVAYTPLLVCGGAVGVLALGELWHRLNLSGRSLVGTEALLAVCGAALVWVLRPGDLTALQTRAGDLFFRSGITETKSLFAAEYGFVFGPMTQLGLVFYLALVPLAWATWVAARRYEPGWLLVAAYTWYFTALAGVQVRFAGQLALFVAVLGGLGFVHLLSAMALAAAPRPFRNAHDEKRAQTASARRDGDAERSTFALPDDRVKLAYLLGVFVLVAGLGTLLVPSLVGQITYSDGEYATAAAIADHAEQTERTDPESYVLSEWDRNRMYNYVANGEAESYSYARETYPAVAGAPDPDDRYGQIDGRVGYVVVDTARVGANATLDGDGNHSAHYRALRVGDDVAGFAVVDGARIEGTAEPGTTVTATTDVAVDGASFEYEREATVGEDGTFSVTVAYPGEYAVGGESVTVSESDVRSGGVVAAGETGERSEVLIALATRE